jgi:hypothetical protein
MYWLSSPLGLASPAASLFFDGMEESSSHNKGVVSGNEGVFHTDGFVMPDEGVVGFIKQGRCLDTEPITLDPLCRANWL